MLSNLSELPAEQRRTLDTSLKTPFSTQVVLMTSWSKWAKAVSEIFGLSFQQLQKLEFIIMYTEDRSISSHIASIILNVALRLN